RSITKPALLDSVMAVVGPFVITGMSSVIFSSAVFVSFASPEVAAINAHPTAAAAAGGSGNATKLTPMASGEGPACNASILRFVADSPTTTTTDTVVVIEHLSRLVFSSCTLQFDTTIVSGGDGSSVGNGGITRPSGGNGRGSESGSSSSSA